MGRTNLSIPAPPSRESRRETPRSMIAALAAADLKAMQDFIFREKILRARRQTPEERLADVFELSNHQFGMQSCSPPTGVPSSSVSALSYVMTPSRVASCPKRFGAMITDWSGSVSRTRVSIAPG